MDGTGIAKLITLLVLIGVFVAAVLVTPRIWQANAPRTGGGPVKAPEPAAADGEAAPKSDGPVRTS